VAASSAERLSEPGRHRSWLPRLRLPEDAFGVFAESFARWMGTAQFLLWMTVIVIVWVAWNSWAPPDTQIDPFPFIFLTLMLSLQASYAAPLILLAQNRQEARDRVSLEQDRRVAEQSRADMDFLAREIASLRVRINDMPTRDFLRAELRDLLDELREEDESETGDDEGQARRR
jgi:uncharacterized membrane protein